MNELFVSATGIGDLFFDEIFLYYDGPCIFSLRNKLDHKFISILETEDDRCDRYVVVPVSIARYKDFVGNRIPIRHVFSKAETDEVLLISFPVNAEPEIVAINSSEVEALNLPEDTEYLDIKESYTQEELLLKSHEERRGITQISFEKNGGHQQSIKANELSIIMKRLQKVYDGIHKDWLVNEGAKASSDLRRAMKRDSQLMVTRTYAASFGVEFSSESVRDLLQESGYDFLTQKFVSIISSINSGESSQHFFAANKESVSALRDFYKVLMSNNFAMRFQTATPHKGVLRFSLSVGDVQSRYNFLSEIIDGRVDQIKMCGRLVAFDLTNQTFKFQPIDEAEINGKLDPDFDETVFDTENIIKILLNKQTELLQSGQLTNKYTLISILDEE